MQQLRENQLIEIDHFNSKQETLLLSEDAKVPK